MTKEKKIEKSKEKAQEKAQEKEKEKQKADAFILNSQIKLNKPKEATRPIEIGTPTAAATTAAIEALEKRVRKLEEEKEENL